MPVWYRNKDGRLMQAVSDIDFSTGAKVTGQISLAQSVSAVLAETLSIDNSSTPKDLWFDREACAEITDISKWNGDIVWSRMWNRTNGVIGRLGYGAITDQRFLNSTVPGFKMDVAEEKYKGVYHYMNTGVSVSNQIDCVLRGLDVLGDDVQAYWEDVEHYYNDASSPNFRNFPEQIMRAVRSERPDLRVGFYTNYQGYIDLGHPSQWLEEFLFWYAWYPYVPTRYPKPPKGLTIGDIYMWQYSADGNGLGYYYGAASTSIDVNVSRDQTGEFLYENSSDYDEEGEIIVPDEKLEAQLRNEQALLIASVQDHSDKMIEIALDIEQVVMYEAVTTDVLKVRNGPGLSFAQIATLPTGESVEVFAEQAADGYTWAKISAIEEEWVANKWLAQGE